MFSVLRSAIDFPLAPVFQGTGSGWLTSAMVWVTTLTAPVVLIVLSLFVTLYFWEYHDRRWGTKIFLLSAGNFLTPLLKELFARPRPTASEIVVYVREVGYGFPSGHALSVALFAAVILLTLRHVHRPSYRFAWWPLTFLIIVVGWSRLALGVHWLSDVVAGVVAAGLWIAVCAVVIWPWLDRVFARRPAIAEAAKSFSQGR